MAEASIALGLVAAVVQIFEITSKSLAYARQLVPSSGGRTTVDISEFNVLLSGYGVAVKRLQGLLDTDIQHRLSNADLARIDSLCKSSLVLSSMIFAEIEQANRKRKPNIASLLGSIKFLLELIAHIQLECTRLEK
jgi:predicted aspartyl protease